MQRLYLTIITHPFQSMPPSSWVGHRGGGGDKNNEHQPPPWHDTTSLLSQPLKNFHISICSDPRVAVARHNQKRTMATDLHDAAPWCYPALAIGPFFTPELAQLFSHVLYHGTRGLPAIRNALHILLFEQGWAAEHKLTLYDETTGLPGGLSLIEYLALNDAPDDYMDICRVYDEACDVLLSR